MLKIKTNNKPRPILGYYELSKRQLNMVKRDCYIMTSTEENENFIFYKNRAFLLSEFMRTTKTGPLGQWDGSFSETYFSGVLIKIIDNDNCIMGSYSE